MAHHPRPALPVAILAAIVGVWATPDIGPLQPNPNLQQQKIAPLTLPYGSQPTPSSFYSAAELNTIVSSWPAGVGPDLPYRDWYQNKVAPQTLTYGAQPTPNGPATPAELVQLVGMNAADIGPQLPYPNWTRVPYPQQLQLATFVPYSRTANHVYASWEQPWVRPPTPAHIAPLTLAYGQQPAPWSFVSQAELSELVSLNPDTTGPSLPYPDWARKSYAATLPQPILTPQVPYQRLPQVIYDLNKDSYEIELIGVHTLGQSSVGQPNPIGPVAFPLPVFNAIIAANQLDYTIELNGVSTYSPSATAPPLPLRPLAIPTLIQTVSAWVQDWGAQTGPKNAAPFLGTLTLVSRTATSTGVTASSVAAPAQTHTAGNLLVALVFHEGAGFDPPSEVTGITNTAGDVWSKTTSTPYDDPVNSSYVVEAWYVLSTKGATNDVVTATLNANTPYCTIVVFEINNSAGSFLYNMDSVGSHNASSTAITTGTLTITGESVVLALYETDAGSPPTSPSGTQGSSDGGGRVYDSYQFTSTSGAASATSSGVGGWTILAAAFTATTGPVSVELPFIRQQAHIWTANEVPRVEPPQLVKIAPLTLPYGQQPSHHPTLVIPTLMNTVAAWAVDWSTQSAPKAIPFTPVPPPVALRPLSVTTTNYIVSTWQQSWNAQTGSKNAAWYVAPSLLVIPHTPLAQSILQSWVPPWIQPPVPVHIAPLTLKYGQQPIPEPPLSLPKLSQIVSTWAQTWDAQTGAKNASWNFPPIGGIYVRRTINWRAGHRTANRDMLGYEITVSTQTTPLKFLMVSSVDHLSPAIGLSPTVSIAKINGLFTSPAGAVVELGDGWYQVNGNVNDTNTVGPLLLHATAPGADPTDVQYEVVTF